MTDIPSFFEPDKTYIRNEPYTAPEILPVFQCLTLGAVPETLDVLAFGFGTVAFPGNVWGPGIVDKSYWGDGTLWLEAEHVDGCWRPVSGFTAASETQED